MPEPGFPVVLAVNLPGLLVRLGWGFLRLQQVRKRGVRAFEVTLRAGGLSPQQAAKLAQSYRDAGSFRGILAEVRRA